MRSVLRAGRATRITADPERVRRLSHRWMPVGKEVVVIGGGLVGLELAEFLAERGRAVTVLEPGPALGLPMTSPRRWTAVRKAAAHGVELVREAEVVEITPDEVVYRAGGAEDRAQAGVEVHVVGDAAAVGYIEGAVHTAWQVAATL